MNMCVAECLGTEHGIVDFPFITRDGPCTRGPTCCCSDGSSYPRCRCQHCPSSVHSRPPPSQAQVLLIPDAPQNTMHTALRWPLAASYPAPETLWVPSEPDCELSSLHPPSPSEPTLPLSLAALLVDKLGAFSLLQELLLMLLDFSRRTSVREVGRGEKVSSDTYTGAPNPVPPGPWSCAPVWAAELRA